MEVKLTTDELKVGDILKENILDNFGNPLLLKGATLSKNYIKKIKQLRLKQNEFKIQREDEEIFVCKVCGCKQK